MKFTWLVCLILILIPIPGMCQIPQIASGGVVNAASFGSPLAPGGIASIFGSNLASGRQSAQAPFPPSLGGTSVTINGLPAPVLFVSPGQVNVQVPSALGAGSLSGGAGFYSVVAGSVIVNTAAGASAPVSFPVGTGYPGFFSIDGSGCGQAAALNITPEGVVSVNSPSNSAAPGDYVAIFGTGFGLAANQPVDGNALAGPSSFLSPVRLLLNMTAVTPSYGGLAPSFPGVDQINFQVPATMRNGCAVPVAPSQALSGPPVTISVQAGRGQCVDPPLQSYGTISFYKSFPESPGQSSESFFAVFPSGPALVPAQSAVASVAILSPLPLNLRSCAVPGYSELSAGAITIQPPSGTAVTVQPQPISLGGASYNQSLPTGFLGAGTYKISGMPGNQFALQTSIQLGSPITVQTNLAPGTAISASQPLTIQWTGGDSSSSVNVEFSAAGLGVGAVVLLASAGSVTIPPPCFTGTCTFGPPTTPVQISVTVQPGLDAVTSVMAPGITFPVQLSWGFSYLFTGLTLTN
jgi:uncharacterized protein (TIGR03437 family)